MVKTCNESERDPWLYNRAHNFVDYAVDENGLWVIYLKTDFEGISVSKIEEVKIVFYPALLFNLSD